MPTSPSRSVAVRRTSRRFQKTQTEATQQIITFSLRQENFALPIQAVQRVVWLEKVYGDPHHTGVSLTLYQGQELLVVDVGHRIFGRRKATTPPVSAQRYLVVVQNAKGELIGLPIDSQPSVRRVPQSSFKAMPEAYVTQGNVRCVSSQMVQLSEDESFFLLDPEQLSQPHRVRES